MNRFYVCLGILFLSFTQPSKGMIYHDTNNLPTIFFTTSKFGYEVARKSKTTGCYYHFTGIGPSEIFQATEEIYGTNYSRSSIVMLKGCYFYYDPSHTKASERHLEVFGADLKAYSVVSLTGLTLNEKSLNARRQQRTLSLDRKYAGPLYFSAFYLKRMAEVKKLTTHQPISSADIKHTHKTAQDDTTETKHPQQGQ